MTNRVDQPEASGGGGGAGHGGPRAPVLIALPKGAMLSGITTWALHLAPALAGRGHRVLVLVHATEGAPTLGPLEGLCRQGVEVRLLRGMPGIDDDVPEPRPEVPAYTDAVRALSEWGGGGPVIAVPTYSAECVGLFAAVSRALPGVVRTVGWMHNDIPYDRRTLEHYEPFLHRFIGVSTEIAAALSRALPHRAAEVVRVPYGVPAPGAVGRRARRGVLRIVSTGRMDREQKRVGALIEMSRALTLIGLEHELTLVGDGPEAGVIDALASERRGVVRRVACEPGEVGAWLERADVFVLASRYEGLSVSMLEAMAHGCVPVVTRVSGASDAVEACVGGSCGVVVDAGEGVDEPGLGASLAEGVVQVMETGVPALSARAHAQARRCFSLEAMAESFGVVCDEVAREPARRWEGRRTSAGGFTVPEDAGERFAAVLARLGAGSRVALWGAGRHTRRLLEEGVGGDARIVAVLDDQACEGARLRGLAVVRPSGVPEMGVTDVIISSALHEAAMWARRSEFERLGVRVHRLYGSWAHEKARAPARA